MGRKRALKMIFRVGRPSKRTEFLGRSRKKLVPVAMRMMKLLM